MHQPGLVAPLRLLSLSRSPSIMLQLSHSLALCLSLLCSLVAAIVIKSARRMGRGLLLPLYLPAHLAPFSRPFLAPCSRPPPPPPPFDPPHARSARLRFLRRACSLWRARTLRDAQNETHGSRFDQETEGKRDRGREERKEKHWRKRRVSSFSSTPTSGFTLGPVECLESTAFGGAEVAARALEYFIILSVRDGRGEDNVGVGRFRDPSRIDRGEPLSQWDKFTLCHIDSTETPSVSSYAMPFWSLRRIAVTTVLGLQICAYSVPSILNRSHILRF